MKKIIICLLCLTSLYSNENIKIAVGAGYKKPLLKLIQLFGKDKIKAIFGNMKQITSQAQHTQIMLIVGDKTYLKKQSTLEFENFTDLGEGRVTIIYSKGKSIKDYKELTKLSKIVMPKPQKAIYGIAGKEFLKNANLYDKLKGNLIIVATVPQATSYVIANEVDGGIVNFTSALAMKDKIGGYIHVPKELYSPITITAGSLKGCNKSIICKDFLRFLTTKEAKVIFQKYGL